MWNRRTLALVAAVAAVGLVAKPPNGVAQSSGEADGARLLKGALDLHFHMDPWLPTATNGQASIADVTVARARGMRGLVIKDHNEPTAPLAYHLRPEVPGLDAFAEVMRAHGFTDRELELMFKVNPAKALGLAPTAIAAP
jgi:hypothetical protein